MDTGTFVRLKYSRRYYCSNLNAPKDEKTCVRGIASAKREPYLRVVYVEALPQANLSAMDQSEQSPSRSKHQATQNLRLSWVSQTPPQNLRLCRRSLFFVFFANFLGLRRSRIERDVDPVKQHMMRHNANFPKETITNVF